MAHFTMCVYCRKTLFDAQWHIECRAEYLEDIVAQIVKSIADKKLTEILPNEILSKVLQERFRIIDEIRKARVEAMEREGRKKLKEIAKQEFLQKCAKDWDEKHPEDEDNDTYDPKALFDETKKDA